MTRIFGALLLVSAALILTSCKDDEPGIPESVVSWTLTLPETASDGTVSDVTALLPISIPVRRIKVQLLRLPKRLS